jgi:hypothetical protein
MEDMHRQRVYLQCVSYVLEVHALRNFALGNDEEGVAQRRLAWWRLLWLGSSVSEALLVWA